jgi:hypothetical protein
VAAAGAAAALALFGLGPLAVPGALAAGSGNPVGSLTHEYPLGTQTLCCGRAATHGPGATSPNRHHHAAPPSIIGQATVPAPQRQPTVAPGSGHGHGHGGVPILLVAVVVLLMLALLAFGFRDALARRSDPPGDPSDPESTRQARDQPTAHDGRDARGRR